jgi:cob(I)alamin adenosyltransferase
MCDQRGAVPSRPGTTLPAGQQYVAALHELRAAIAEAERRIDRLMVIRRRELAAARSHQRGK